MGKRNNTLLFLAVLCLGVAYWPQIKGYLPTGLVASTSPFGPSSKGLRVAIIAESDIRKGNYTLEQKDAINSIPLREFIESHGGKFAILDPDTEIDVQLNSVSKDSTDLALWKTGLENAAKAKSTLPVLAIGHDTSGEISTITNTEAALAAVNKYVAIGN